MEKEFIVKVVKNGPLVVSGDFKLLLPSGEEQEVTRKTFFCRCGQSKNKPYCDGAHAGIKFDE